MSRAHVLLVSEDRQAAEHCTSWFAERTALEATCVSSLDEARAKLAQSEADLVLYDVTRFRHWDDCACIGQAAGSPPVVVMTGWVASDGSFRQRAFDSGCAAFVSKPCHPRVLACILRRVLDGERRIAIA